MAATDSHQLTPFFRRKRPHADGRGDEHQLIGHQRDDRMRHLGRPVAVVEVQGSIRQRRHDGQGCVVQPVLNQTRAEGQALEAGMLEEKGLTDLVLLVDARAVRLRLGEEPVKGGSVALFPDIGVWREIAEDAPGHGAPPSAGHSGRSAGSASRVQTLRTVAVVVCR